ncbi:hypothetical protein DRQ07_07155 [candidate division KSB1 bacterium]|nr:MAG: hypothetical protein DRQ07_07155 [candidate division KSB1 bacterium]
MSATLFELIFIIKQQCISTEEKICKELNLTCSEFKALITLSSEDILPGNTFSEKLGLSPSRGSRVLSQLRDSGYANVDFNSSDRRSVSISLTKKGIAMKEEIMLRIMECESKILTGFSEREAGELKKMLTKLAEHMIHAKLMQGENK